MLRITTPKAGAAKVLKLEGAIRGPWVVELKSVWVASNTSFTTPIIDLEDVTFIDEEGRRLLLEMAKAGALLAKPSPFISLRLFGDSQLDQELEDRNKQ